MAKVRIPLQLSGVIASFPHLDEPRAIDPTQKPKYSLLCLATASVNSAELVAIQAGFHSIVSQVWPNTQKDPATGQYVGLKGLPVKMGTAKHPTEVFYADKVLLNMASPNKPFVIGQDGLTQIPGDTIYPGCIVNVKFNLYDYGVAAQKGVTFGLTGVQFVRDGDRLDDRPDPSALFEAVEGARADAAVNPFAETPQPPAQTSRPVATPQNQITGDFSDMLG